MPGATSWQTGPRGRPLAVALTVRACGGGAPFCPPRCPRRDDHHLLDTEPAGDRADRRGRLAVRDGPSPGGARRNPSSAPRRGGVLCRLGNRCARPGLADRRLRGGLLQRPHGPAPAAHTPCASPARAGRADHPRVAFHAPPDCEAPVALAPERPRRRAFRSGGRVGAVRGGGLGDPPVAVVRRGLTEYGGPRAGTSRVVGGRARLLVADGGPRCPA